MYESYFNLKERPFSIAPDPRYLYLSPRHKEALGHLAYGVRSGSGFVLLTGEVGTGKTTVCRQVLRKLPENTRLAFILNPMLDSIELLASLCDELGVDYNDQEYSLKDLTDNLTRFLLDCHNDNINVVLMIDEAQNLQPEVLEQIRLLTNLETDQKKLLQIILVGQPELQSLLARQQLRQLAQRVTARYHLRPLSRAETEHYIKHRIRIANGPLNLFHSKAIRQVYTVSGGVPRLINNLCDRALMAAFSEETRQVSKKHINAAKKEAMPSEILEQGPNHSSFSWSSALLLSVVVITIGVLAGLWITHSNVAVNPFTQTPIDKTDTNGQQKASRLQVKPYDEPKNDNKQKDQANPTGDGEHKRLSDLLKRVGQMRSTAIPVLSQQALAERWRLDYKTNQTESFCTFVGRYGLQCYRDGGSWKELITLNRPANVQLESPEGLSAWATLVDVEQNAVTLQLNREVFSITLTEFLSLWTREFQILWRAPVGFSGSIKIGDSGESVRWLGERLAFLSGDNRWQTSNQFSSEMEDAIKRFQISRGIKADGIVGMNTMIQLTDATVKGIPRLIYSSATE